MRVVDASLAVAALVDGGPDGTWADYVLAAGPVAAPHLLPVEVANVLRRSVALSPEMRPAVAGLDALEDPRVSSRSSQPRAARTDVRPAGVGHRARATG